MQETFSTREIPTYERLTRWQQSTSDIFADDGFYCVADTADSLVGDLQHWRYDAINVFEIAASAHRVFRTASTGHEPAILLTLQLDGVCRTSQDGRTDFLNPGDFTLFDSTRKFSLCFDGPVRQRVLRIPGHVFHQHLAVPRRAAGLSVRGENGTGYIASHLIQSFLEAAEDLDSAEISRVFRSVIDVVNAATLSALDSDSLAASNYSAFNIHRIRIFIEENLNDPDLTPDVIARSNGISQRTLNKLFEAEGVSVSKHLWRRRLERCRQDLSDPRMAGQTVTEIAHAWGFKSSSHFSRVFKERFGLSPREARSQKALARPH